jgi:membrane protein DedA with SNARE-associated domain
MESILKFIAGLIASLGSWGYVVIFLGAALECSVFLGVFVPGDGLVLLAGFFAHRGVLELSIVIPVVVVGALIGDSVGYVLGRRLGDPWLRKHGGKFGLNKKRLDQTEKFFRKHAGMAVLLGRSISLAAAPVPFLSGASRMRYPVFLAYDAAGVLIWGVGFTLLGYGVGASWQVVEKWIGRGSLILVGVAVLAFVVWKVWRHKKDAS